MGHINLLSDEIIFCHLDSLDADVIVTKKEKSDIRIYQELTKIELIEEGDFLKVSYEAKKKWVFESGK